MSTSCGWEGKGRLFIPIADERVGVQVKLWNPFRTRAILERFCGGDSLRRGAISSVWTFTLWPFKATVADNTGMLVMCDMCLYERRLRFCRESSASISSRQAELGTKQVHQTRCPDEQSERPSAGWQPHDILWGNHWTYATSLWETSTPVVKLLTQSCRVTKIKNSTPKCKYDRRRMQIRTTTSLRT